MADLAHFTVTTLLFVSLWCCRVRECAEVFARSSSKHETLDLRFPALDLRFRTFMPVSFWFYSVKETCIKVRNLKSKVGN